MLNGTVILQECPDYVLASSGGQHIFTPEDDATQEYTYTIPANTFNGNVDKCMIRIKIKGAISMGSKTGCDLSIVVGSSQVSLLQDPVP